MLAAVSAFAASVMSFSVEPMKATKSNDYFHQKESKAFWLFGAEYGWLINEHFSLGPSINFSWNLEKNRVTDTAAVAEGMNLVKSKERVIAVPISVFMVIDPIPQFMFHPIIRAQVGYNSVFISNVNYDKDLNNNPEAKERVKLADGYYNGIYTKFGAELMVDIGKQISLFAGPQWQISEVERRGKKPVSEFNFNGFGFRFGASILL
jgi:hypothetical protein